VEFLRRNAEYFERKAEEAFKEGGVRLRPVLR